MKGEERVRLVDPYETFAVSAIDHKPLVGPIGEELQGIENIPGPEHFDAAFGEVGVEDAQEDIVLCEHEGVQISAQDWPSGYGGKDGRFSGGGRDAEDSTGGLSTNLKIEVVGIACHGIRPRMSGCQGSFQIWMEFVMFCETNRFEGRGVKLLKGAIVRFEPDAAHSSR